MGKSAYTHSLEKHNGTTFDGFGIWLVGACLLVISIV
jgi:hypothetical protein